MELETKLKVCDFCYQQHMKFGGDLKFSYAKKEAITRCTICNHGMCMDCHRNSVAELGNSILAVYDFSLCYECHSSYWIYIEVQEWLEQRVKEYVAECKKRIKKDAYFVTQKLPWQQ